MKKIEKTDKLIFVRYYADRLYDRSVQLRCLSSHSNRSNKTISASVNTSGLAIKHEQRGIL